MEWGSFSASPTELIGLPPRCPGQSPHSTAPLLRFSAPFTFLREQRGIDWRIYLVLLLRLQMWISRDTRSFFRFGENATAAFCRFLPGRSVFLDFGSLRQEPRVGGTLGRVRRDGSDGWRSPVPRGDNTGGRFSTSSANHPVSVPPTGLVLHDEWSSGQCTRWRASRGVSCCGSHYPLPRRCGDVTFSLTP